jgi:sigma-B regulation protein RsbU (phosphoserine phosphatase)
MKVLIAEDDPISRRLLQSALLDWGYEPVVVADGLAGWEALQGQDAPNLAILDWCMPELDGLEVCRRARAKQTEQSVYLILLTARDSRSDVVAGLQAGANDYVTKPFDREELRSRIAVGCQVVALQQSLAKRVRELEEALSHVKQLRGILPICAYCKKVRNDSNYWQQVESYLLEHSELMLSHGICPDCLVQQMNLVDEQLG